MVKSHSGEVEISRKVQEQSMHIRQKMTAESKLVDATRKFAL